MPEEPAAEHSDVPAVGLPADPESVARAICLRLLTGRPRTRAELAGELRRQGVPDDTATAVLDRFGEVGLVDDAAFAQQWVHSRHVSRGLARKALAAELRRRGVDDALAGPAVAALDDDDEERRARQLVRRRMLELGSVEQVTAARRLVAMLGRKGYPKELADGVVRAVLAEHGVFVEPDG